MQEKQLEFSSQGTTCRGVLYRPEAAKGKLPCIIMAHGFALTHASGLLAFKQAFCDAGYAVFAFDYRSFGDSDGEPRQVMIPDREVEDYLSATRYVRTLSEVDGQRICLWGTSFAGGLVIKAAARDGNVQATISQCPLMDGIGGVMKVISYAGIGRTGPEAFLSRNDRCGALDAGHVAALRQGSRPPWRGWPDDGTRLLRWLRADPRRQRTQQGRRAHFDVPAVPQADRPCVARHLPGSPAHLRSRLDCTGERCREGRLEDAACDGQALFGRSLRRLQGRGSQGVH